MSNGASLRGCTIEVMERVKEIYTRYPFSKEEAIEICKAGSIVAATKAIESLREELKSGKENKKGEPPCQK